MSNRILKESVCTSDNLDTLSWFEEVFFYRLIVNCDDYGRMDARPAILRSKLFPLKAVTHDQVGEALEALQTAGIVCLYEADGRPYLQLRTWERHQVIRAKRSKYPAPDDPALSGCESDGRRMLADACECLRNPIQSESTKESNPNDGMAQAFVFPCNGFLKERPILQAEVDEWAVLYPSVDVPKELRKMIGWLNANPSRRKTQDGTLRFIVNWLSREQDKGPRLEEEKTGITCEDILFASF